MKDTLFVCFARNNPDNGRAQDQVEMIECHDGAGDPVFELEGDPLLFLFEPRLFRVSVAGVWFATKSDLQRWVGNWCWDGLRLHTKQAAAMLNLLRREHWDMTSGEERLFNRWHSGEPITEADVRAAWEPACADGRVGGEEAAG